MKNLSIGLRLALSYTFIAMLIVFMLITGLMKLEKIGEANEYISGSVYLKTLASLNLSFYSSDMNRLARSAIIITDKSKRDKSIQHYKDERNEVNKLIDFFERNMSTQKGKEAYSRLKANSEKFLPFLDEVVGLAEQGKSEESSQLLFGPRYRSQDAFLASVAEMKTIQSEHLNQALDESRKERSHAKLILITAGIISLTLAAIFAWVITRSITLPLKSAVQVAQRVSRGDLSSILSTNRTDETGKLLIAIGEMQNSLIATVSSVRRNAESVATASSQIAQGNADLSQRTEEQASALEETAATMSQLDMTVKSNLDNAKQASLLAVDVQEVANKGHQATSNINDTMKLISQSSARIGDITAVIEGIAFQTNILALNAAVEAARAGEHGRGFAVVASEVRSLAQRSSKAAGEIKQLVDSNATTVSSGNDMVEHASVTMSDIIVAVVELTSTVEEITSASAEQARGIEQVGIAVADMDRTTQQNAALVEESASAALSLNEQAKTLLEAVSAFNLEGSANHEPYDVTKEKEIISFRSEKVKQKVNNDWVAF
ncbi:methyl-accepting chemotaxis protein [Pantoea stewartii]|uniref:methyl-accepting chemotaxis protein n=1 Tax=Pantoea stewartii TaxID=66269 RepID=UPI0016276E3D|nr:methyl-accepting chemotaxis protein [Pantoea stewartii]MBC0856516.1 MCP four helix bundle domain-containing protein [Pantoea stewartii]